MLAIGAGAPDRLEMLREWTFDLYQRMWPRQDSASVVIVEIDEASLSRYGQWPWPRSRLAELIDRINAAGPRAVGLDVLLAEPDRLSPESLMRDLVGQYPELVPWLAVLPSNDARLAEALARGHVVLAQAADERGGLPRWDSSRATPVENAELGRDLQSFPGMIDNLPMLERSAAGRGILNTALDPGTVIRDVPLVVRVAGQIVPSLSLELVRVGVGANWLSLLGDGQLAGVGMPTLPWPIGTGPQGRMRLYYSSRITGRLDDRVVSAADILAGDVDPVLLEGRLVLIGVTALGAIDRYPTPVATFVPGVEIHAEAIENMLDRAWLTVPRWAWAYPVLTLALGGLLLIWLVPRLGLTLSSVPLLALLTAIPASSYALFLTQRLLLDPVLPVLGVLLVFGSLASSRYLVVAAALRRELLASEHIAGELDAARRIQMGILPDPAAIEGLPPHVVIAARILPAREVGGDFFDAFMLDGRRLFFILGDVSGKGVPAALFMAISKSLCRSVALRGEPAPGRILEALEAEMWRENAAALFVTAVAGVLDTETGTLALSSAGHPPPLRVLPARIAEACVVPRAPPLCARSGTRYRSAGQRLADGDRLLLVSDGVLDAFSERPSLAQAELAAIAAEATSGSAAALVERVLDHVRATDATAPPDDVAVLVLSWRAPAETLSGS